MDTGQDKSLEEPIKEGRPISYPTLSDLIKYILYWQEGQENLMFP